jgi:hypothetical protein
MEGILHLIVQVTRVTALVTYGQTSNGLHLKAKTDSDLLKELGQTAQPSSLVLLFRTPSSTEFTKQHQKHTPAGPS